MNSFDVFVIKGFTVHVSRETIKKYLHVLRKDNQKVSTCMKEGIVKNYLHVSRKDNQEVPT